MIPSSTLWNRPWAQSVLPFLTSLTFHAAVLVTAAALVVGGARVYEKVTPLETQVGPTDTSIIDTGPPGGVQHVGLDGDPSRPPAQDEFPDGGDAWAPRPGDARAAPTLPGAVDGDAPDPVIGFSPAGGGFRLGAGDRNGPGTGDGSGPLAPFGARGGGAPGFMGINDRDTAGTYSVVYVCDASGSMINTFSSLKEQLVLSFTRLKSIQSFNVIFFQDEKCSAMNDGLLFATPDSKRKALAWLDGQTTTGTTNPIPGIEMAFKSKPQLVYLLTDGDFPDNDAVKRAIARLNKDKLTRVNTILFTSGDGNDAADASASFKTLMQQIATDNGGVFAHVREGDLR